MADSQTRSSRTAPTHAQEVHIHRPGQDVTFIFPDPGARVPRTRIVIPPDSTWSPSPHWHERYTEHFRVVQGDVVFVLEDEQRIINPDSGIQRVERGQVHNFWRAKVHGEDNVIVEEWTDPADGSKEIFFRNLFGVIQDAPKPLTWRTILQIRQIETKYDNWPVIVHTKWCRGLATHLVQRSGSWMAWLLGYRPFHSKYVPANIAGL